MKLGMTSLTLRECEIENVIKHAKEAGLKGIEWGVCEKHVSLDNNNNVEKIKRLSKESGIEIFSLGSYCYMEKIEECEKNIKTAILLNAPVIRVWAGVKAPSDCDDAYIKTIVSNTRYMADIAKEHGIKIGFEYHNHSLTENAESAINLIKKIDRENVGLYWQPNHILSVMENIKERKAVLPYCVGNLHIQNFTPEEGYKALEEISDALSLYFGDIKNENYNLMIEFVKDNTPENLIKDAKQLKKCLINKEYKNEKY
ncbi:MAG: sugar phosphate isomerase/epimerase [Clostridia bacterium]|nr:sugar phosphate isomerase/epimerase [Clostridia bacterium]